MEDNIYLDKVVEFLVRDTRIDYKSRVIHTPFYSSSPSLDSTFFDTFKILLPSFSPRPFYFFFPDYCKDVYGLTDDEIKYVWNIYKDIIKEKVENGR